MFELAERKNLLMSPREIKSLGPVERVVTNYDPIQEEWTKYFVNGLECDREDIYQTILENEFYQDTLKIDKKYHYSKQKKNSIEEKQGAFFSQEINTNNQSKNSSASFNLETKKFVQKYSPDTGELQLLVAHMVLVVDMFLDCNINYKDNAKSLQLAMGQCMSYLFEKLSDSDQAYELFYNKLTVELFVFMFDNLAFLLSKSDLINLQNKSKELPSLAIDASSIKETWDEKWSNIKKSHYLQNYLSVLKKSTEALFETLKNHELLTDKTFQTELKEKFDAFQNTLKEFQIKKEAIDESIPEVANQSFLSKYFSFFPVYASPEAISNTSNTLSL